MESSVLLAAGGMLLSRGSANLNYAILAGFVLFRKLLANQSLATVVNMPVSEIDRIHERFATFIARAACYMGIEHPSAWVLQPMYL